MSKQQPTAAGPAPDLGSARSPETEDVVERQHDEHKLQTEAGPSPVAKERRPLSLGAIVEEFSLRLVLVALTLLAALLWWWLSPHQPGDITFDISRLFAH